MDVELYSKEKELAYIIAEECIKKSEMDIQNYIKYELDNYIIKNDFTLDIFKNRIRIFEFLNYQIMAFNEYMTEKYMLNAKYINRASIGKNVICGILSDYKTNDL
jgi:hypothetical protein